MTLRGSLHGRALLVEHEPLLRRVLERMLVRLGLDVVAVGTTAAARSRFASGERFDVVVCGAALLEHADADLVAELRLVDAELAALVVAASSRGLERRAEGAGLTVIVAPFDLATLHAALAKELDGRAVARHQRASMSVLQSGDVVRDDAGLRDPSLYDVDDTPTRPGRPSLIA